MSQVPRRLQEDALLRVRPTGLRAATARPMTMLAAFSGSESSASPPAFSPGMDSPRPPPQAGLSGFGGPVVAPRLAGTTGALTADQQQWVAAVRSRISSQSRSRSRSSSLAPARPRAPARAEITPQRAGVMAAATLMPPPTTTLKRRRDEGALARQGAVPTFVTPRAAQAVSVKRRRVALDRAAPGGFSNLIRMARVQAFGQTVKELDVVMTLVRKTIEQLRMEGAAFPEYTRFQAELEGEFHNLLSLMDEQRSLERGTAAVVDAKKDLRAKILAQKKHIAHQEALIAKAQAELDAVTADVHAAEGAHDFVSALQRLVSTSATDAASRPSSAAATSRAHHTNLQAQLVAAVTAASNLDHLRAINERLAATVVAVSAER
ncbi:uncharacterized protein AMSG_02644 [Thecamonas trahens ATCC 50062]|uniref:Uncharacterized protein n=1 Tax=Thecamonas trahens ATCC 50062 TaxID=461836 RepID=A0A0L0D612_THETB|nr:hypothetical protein AMSG_02644 [Thecamonas trahens ATCC 50062]KNC47620.1 hypothetical protein AMSG_02644 [Thecamonas trahens ATCC 50062]|eukprot:XP_013759545.1 hypothetical protein AMSG_02644 [Thecamonas trahens ATCC 50062]